MGVVEEYEPFNYRVWNIRTQANQLAHMDLTYFIGNWKSNKTIQETDEFLWKFSSLLPSLPLDKKKIVVCPSFTALEHVVTFIKANDLPISVGAQNVSAFEQGAYTGEVFAGQIKELADFVIIAHSERKRLFHETGQDVIKNKVDCAKNVGLAVVLCVQDENDTVIEGVDIIAYEPPSAIGSGKPDSPENIARVFTVLHEKYPTTPLLYGGSVADENGAEFIKIPYLKGFLIGGASLDPQKFASLISVC